MTRDSSVKGLPPAGGQALRSGGSALRDERVRLQFGRQVVVDPGAVEEYYVRFSKPVVVPDDGVGALLEVTGKVVKALDERRVQVDLTVVSAGQKVLGKASAVVRRS